MLGRNVKGSNTDGVEKPGAWSVGRELITGNLSQTVSLQAVFDPGDYTIQFNLEIQPQNLAAALAIRAVALITWSVRGNQVTRRVNVGNGVSVSGNAEGVRVVMSDTTDLTGGALGIPYNVTATVTRGTRPSTEQPPILMPFPGGPGGIIAIAPAGVFTIPIPTDAGVISSLVTVVSAPPPLPILEQQVQVSQVDQSGGQVASYDPRAFAWVPMAPGATSLQINNFDAAQTIFVQCFFGIDG